MMVNLAMTGLLDRGIMVCLVTCQPISGQLAGWSKCFGRRPRGCGPCLELASVFLQTEPLPEAARPRVLPQHPATEKPRLPWVAWSWLSLSFQTSQFASPEQVATTWAEPRP
jgi:hypothetical protein